MGVWLTRPTDFWRDATTLSLRGSDPTPLVPARPPSAATRLTRFASLQSRSAGAGQPGTAQPPVGGRGALFGAVGRTRRRRGGRPTGRHVVIGDDDLHRLLAEVLPLVHVPGADHHIARLVFVRGALLVVAVEEGEGAG